MEKIKKVPFLAEVVGGIFPDMREREPVLIRKGR